MTTVKTRTAQDQAKGADAEGQRISREYAKAKPPATEATEAVLDAAQQLEAAIGDWVGNFQNGENLNRNHVGRHPLTSLPHGEFIGLGELKKSIQWLTRGQLTVPLPSDLG